MTRDRRNFISGIAFLTPNILGVLTFVVFPVVFSLYMAFTNWDLTLHNQFKPDASIEFVGLDNFIELVTGDRFPRFLGNTLFFMMGIPFSVAASLIAAMLLSSDTRAGGGRNYLYLLSVIGLIAGVSMLSVVGLGQTAMTILLVGAAAGILLAGVTGGLTFYRTLFYTPHFVAGVATFILWKQLYAAKTGPVNLSLQPALTGLGEVVNTTPAAVYTGLFWLGLVLMLGLFYWGSAKLRRMVVDGDLGKGAAVVPLGLLLIPVVVGCRWGMTSHAWWLLGVGAAAILAYHAWVYSQRTDRFPAKASEGFGSGFVIALMVMVGQFVLLGLAPVADALPAMADTSGSGDGLSPPSWLTDVSWAKPALMIMGFWAAIGSNNMLLYLAALTNVPGELYEASNIDGASPLQRFWNVTWPQLAPTTFFILVMSTIGGLQGGFEMARVMTQGGPAGATTTLSYFIYQEGFETGRLGYASAVAWTLFLLIFSVTLFNWKFGNKYVND
ncbi:MAG: sugar ABC transporter permease [Planctomycetota bacterium]